MRTPTGISDNTFWATRPVPPDSSAGHYITYDGPGQFWTPFALSEAKGHVCKTKASGTCMRRHGHQVHVLQDKGIRYMYEKTNAPGACMTRHRHQVHVLQDRVSGRC